MSVLGRCCQGFRPRLSSAQPPEKCKAGRIESPHQLDKANDIGGILNKDMARLEMLFFITGERLMVSHLGAYMEHVEFFVWSILTCDNAKASRTARFITEGSIIRCARAGLLCCTKTTFRARAWSENLAQVAKVRRGIFQ